MTNETTASAAPTTASPAAAKRPRGFAAMSREKQRELASKGGKASHEQGTGHQWNSETARAAGKKGGEASRNRAKGYGSTKPRG